MIRIGESLNSSIAGTRKAIEQRDGETIAELARRQLDAGADWLDVNAAAFMEGEPDALKWMIGVVQMETGARLMIDSPNAKAIAAALAADTVGSAIVNSVTLEERRLTAMLPLVKQYGAGVVALPIAASGMPRTPEERLSNAAKLVGRMAAEGIPQQRIYIDALVGALAADSSAASVTLETVRLLRAAFPDINIICGISNVSYGLPMRKRLNAAFLTGVLLAGANAAILDVTDPAIRDAAIAAEALCGRDDYCAGYIAACRNNAAPKV